VISTDTGGGFKVYLSASHKREHLQKVINMETVGSRSRHTSNRKRAKAPKVKTGYVYSKCISFSPCCGMSHFLPSGTAMSNNWKTRYRL
jgi:hypothetical protein